MEIVLLLVASEAIIRSEDFAKETDVSLRVKAMNKKAILFFINLRSLFCV